jgi:hypothetical protein
MPKIDTSSWGEFRIGDYFKVEYGKFRPKEELGKGDFNYVTTSGFNNGITDKIDKADHIGNCITVASDGAMGVSFYQEKPFATSNIVSTLTPFETTPLNKYNALFLCTLIFSKRGEFGWLGYKFSVDRVRNLKLKLPIDSSGEPDWQYMEDYMRNIEVRVSTSISKLESAQGVENSKIDVSSWGEFPLIELFDFYLSKGDNQAQKLDEGEIPLVSSGSFNNGICKYIDKGDGISELFEGNLITIDMFGQPFYQNNPFYSVSHGRVNILKPKFHINEYIGLFIVSVLQKMYYEKYGFTTMCSQTKLKKEYIKLPITKDNKPDWQYMEEYMENIESKVKRKIDMLIQI